MIPNNSILKYLPKPEGKETVNFKDGENKNIISVIHANMSRAVKQTKAIAPYFEGGDAKTTAYNVHEYLRKNINYVNDGSDKQRIRLPSDLLYNKKGDCKSFTLFSAAILSNLRYKNYMEYASYDILSTTPTHVYSVTFDNNNNPIYLDAVHTLYGGKFNTRKAPKYFKDYNMEISTISGISGTMIGCPDNRISGTMIGASKLKTAVKKAASNVKTTVKKDAKKVQTVAKKAGANIKTTVKKDAKKVQTAAKKTLKVVKTVGIAPAREAFKALLLLNYRGWANILNAHLSDSLALWQKLGGDQSVLKSALQKGMMKKPMLAGKKQQLKIKQVARGEYSVSDPAAISGTMIGSASVAAILSAAATIIVAFTSIINRGGGGVKAGDDGTDPGTDTGSLLDKAKELFSAGADVVSQYTGTDSGSTDSGTTETPGDSGNAPAVSDNTGSWFSKPLNLGLLAVGLYFGGKALKIIK